MVQMIKPVKKPAKSKIQNARIVFILDRSGSMSSIREQTISGYNAFIEKQKELGGKAKVTLIQFDNEYIVSYKDVDIQEVVPLDTTTFVPRGMTALCDSIGKTIIDLEAAKPAKNTKTIVGILTDGAENASSEFDQAKVNQLITRVEDELGWDVIFVGANMNAQEIARGYGIKMNNAATFTASAKGSIDVMNTMSASTSILRGAKLKGFAGGKEMDAKNYDTQAIYAAYTSNENLKEEAE